jgi:transcription antitermination factor NusG
MYSLFKLFYIVKVFLLINLLKNPYLGILIAFLNRGYKDLFMEWFALYVKSRHEFVALDELQKKGIATFLPSVKRWRLWKDRRKLIEFPLFPGYLFVNLSPGFEEFANVLKTRGAVTFISAEPGHPSSVSHEEINFLKLLIESGKELDIYPHLTEGACIRVRRGPLKGAEGVLMKKQDQHMLLVNIKLLGRSVGLKIYADDIENG